MKKILVPAVGIIAGATLLGANLFFGAATASEEAVGIIVKNGAKMDTLLADNFVISNEGCDPTATTTPTDCTRTLYQGRPVNVFYTAPEHMTRSQTQLSMKIGAFPFAGSTWYVNRAQEDVEPKLIQYMLEQGNSTYTIIYEP